MNKVLSTLVLAALAVGMVAPQAAQARWFMKKNAQESTSAQAMPMSSDSTEMSGMKNKAKCGCSKKSASPTSMETIPQVAQQAGQFTILLQALKAADLDGALMQDGPFTVFAPTDAAFRKAFSAQELSDLLKPQNRDKLTKVLKFHVVPGQFTSQEVMGSTDLKTLEGESLDVATQGNQVKVEKAQIIQTDVNASNGVIHVIDTVLMPNQ